MMAIMKIVNNTYPDYNSVDNLFNYILNREHGWIGDIASNLLLTIDTSFIAEQMRKVSAFFGKDNRRLVRHMVISYDPYYENWISPEQRMHNIRECMEIYFPENQWMTAMHEKDDETHIHIVYNLTNVYTGEQLCEGGGFFEKLAYGFSCHGFMGNEKMRNLRYLVCYGDSF